jgi:hypothetical protein
MRCLLLLGQPIHRGMHLAEPLPFNPKSLESVRTTFIRKEKQQMPESTSTVAIYDTHLEAEAAVKEIQRAGFDMKKLSIVGRDYHTDEQVVGYYNSGDRMLYWGKAGAFWGGLWGLLFGSAFFWVPALGPLLVAGPLVAWIIGALEGAVVFGGLSAVGAALFGLGVPRDSVLRYETALKSGSYVVIAHGTPEDVVRAHDIIVGTSPKAIELIMAKDLAGHQSSSPSR